MTTIGNPVSFPTQNPVDAWADFVVAMSAALQARRGRWGRSYRRTLEDWHVQTFKELGSPDFKREFGAAWSRNFGEQPDGDRAERLLRAELTGVTDMLLDLVDVENVSAPARERQRKSRWTFKPFRRAVGLTETIKAGGTLLGTLKDLLSEGSPWWVKALLIIAQEAADVASDNLK